VLRNEAAPPRSPGGGDITQRKLLQSIVEVARSVYGAAAASVFLLDAERDELVFEAVAGEGEDQLVGTSFPSGTGIAGWVAVSGQPLLVDDVSQSPQFARDAAESTGYVPRSIMAAPLIRAGECIGVLEVLDRGSRDRGELGDVDLLGLLATELASALELLIKLRRVTGETPDLSDGAGPASMSLIQRVAERLPDAPEPVAIAVSQLLVAADQLLGGPDLVASRTHA